MTIIPSIAIKRYTTNKQLNYLLKKIPYESTVVLMFHSVLKKEDHGYGRDDYYWDYNRFLSFCSFLSNEENVNCGWNLKKKIK